MIGELEHVQNPHRSRRAWLVFYILLFIGLLAIFWAIADRIRTYAIPSGAIQLVIPYKEYLVGEPITFTLKNNYNSAIYVTNNCPSEPLAVYRYENNKWVRLHELTDVKNCPTGSRQVKVPAGGEQSGSYANWPTLFSQPGKYRVVAYVDYFDVAPYQDFEVITKPAPAPPPIVTPAPAKTLPAPLPTTRYTEPSDSNDSAGGDAVTTTPTSQNKTISVSSGSINVSYTSTYITVQSISPAAGCTYEGGQSGSSVQVTFKCTNTQTQVTLRLSNGQIVVRTEQGD